MRPEKAVQRVYGVRGVANDIEVKLSSTRTDPEIARDARTNKEELLEKPKDVGCPFRGSVATLESNAVGYTITK